MPSDTKSWSQILVSVLTGVSGRNRQKGSDLDDGSDVKGANVWGSIDTPRFNGAIPAGRKSTKSAKSLDLSALDGMPFIYFVLWDHTQEENLPRCRIWIARPELDKVFRKMCAKWYEGRVNGTIGSDNFQLHPPRNLDTDIIRNTCGNLIYPLLFSAILRDGHFRLKTYDPSVLNSGLCTAC